jgi:hypothetical protein
MADKHLTVKYCCGEDLGEFTGNKKEISVLLQRVVEIEALIINS